jgi:hypothetical protein
MRSRRRGRKIFKPHTECTEDTERSPDGDGEGTEVACGGGGASNEE